MESKAITCLARKLIGLMILITIFYWSSNFKLERSSNFKLEIYKLDYAMEVEVNQFDQNSSSQSIAESAEKVNHECRPCSLNNSSYNVSSENVTESVGCDLFHGNWIHDSMGPLYTGSTCDNITRQQNCQNNGRPDKAYENWRWKPDNCELARFDARKFLELMKGKSLVFVGDSVARNQMESLLCLLSQIEVPRDRGSRRRKRLIFGSTSTTISRIWSSWLVNSTKERDVTKVHLDTPDTKVLEHVSQFDVAVISSGHWFNPRVSYVLNGTAVGVGFDNVDAYGTAMDTVLTAVATLPNYDGVTIVRSYSPEHYTGGAWNTGGSCSAFIEPTVEPTRSEYAGAMHDRQVASFERARGKVSNRSRLRLMDVTELSAFRHDGHPGRYTRPAGSSNATKGKEDCLHWCMPGPIDTWNEILYEILKREFQGK